MTQHLSRSTTKLLLASIIIFCATCVLVVPRATPQTAGPTKTKRVDTLVLASLSTNPAPSELKLFEAFDSSFKRLASAEHLNQSAISESNHSRAQLARYQQAFLQHWQTGQHESNDGHPLELLEFNLDPPTANDELSYDFQTILLTHKVRLADEIIFCDKRLHACLLDHLEKYALQAESPAIKCTGIAVLAYYNDHQSVDPKATQGHIIRLTELARQTPGTIADTILPYLNSRFATNENERQNLLDQSFAAAEKLDSQYFLGKLIEKQIPGQMHDRDFGKVRELHLSRLTAAEQFGSKVEKIRCLKQLAKFEIGHGKDLVAAEKFLHNVRADPAFKHLDRLTQEAIWRGLFSIFHRTGETQKAAYCRSNLSTYRADQAMAESIKSRTAVIADTLQRSDLSNDLSQELDQSKSDTSVLTGRLSQLKKLVNRYAWILSATISLLACGVLAYLTRVKTLAAGAELAKQQAIVAEEKKKVAELQVKVERLKRAQSLGTMAGSVAHDFNNLLFGVSGNAELIEMSLEKGTLDADFGHARIAAILDASNRAQSLARQMLDFAGKRCLNLVDIDLNEFLRKEKGIIESTSQNHLFEFELSETPVKVSADDTQLAQTILNFATNAVEASAPGSKITFRTFFDDIESVENRTNLFGTRNLGGRFAVLEITDQGVGIKPGTIGQIFEPYFSTKNTSGRGLGLAVVYGMAESLEGFIRCYSTPGVGTKFQLLLPVLSGTSPNAIVDDQVSPADSHTPDEFKRKHANKRVLIVDDELSVSETCRQLLSQLGLNYESVYNGVDAIERLSASNGQSDFDAILLDVVMPSLNGDEVLQQLKDLKIEIPVVVMSGFSPERLDKFLNVPLVSAALPKPFSFHELANALSVALGRPADVVTRTTERLDASHELKSPNTDVSKSTSATERKP